MYASSEILGCGDVSRVMKVMPGLLGVNQTLPIDAGEELDGQIRVIVEGGHGNSRDLSQEALQ